MKDTGLDKGHGNLDIGQIMVCLLYTSDAADERSSVDLGGRRIIKKKTTVEKDIDRVTQTTNKQKHKDKGKQTAQT